MRAIQAQELGGPEVMQLGEAEAPTPGPGQLLIQVEAAGINPLDAALRTGNHPRARFLQLPWTPGAEAAGTVTALGPGVDGFSVGDRVYGGGASGTYAEQALLTASRTATVPDNVSTVDASSLPVVLFTALYGLVHRGGLSVGETVLVHGGAGGVGMMGIQVAKAAGARVITTVSSTAKGDFARGLGADVVINYRDEDLVERCLAETDGRGVDLVLEMVATENFDKDCAALRPFGRLVLLGAGTGKNPAGSVSFPAFYSKNIDVLGFSLFNAEQQFPEMLRQAGTLLASGAVRPHVGATVPLAEAARSHELLMSGAVFGKIVLTT